MASIRKTKIGDVLIIKKIAQHYGNGILTNYSDHPGCSYGKSNNPNHILHVGTKLKVIGKGKPQTKWRQSYVTVSYKGTQFDILCSDIRRFCK